MDSPWSFVGARSHDRTIVVDVVAGDVFLTLEPTYDYTGRLDTLTLVGLCVGRDWRCARANIGRVLLGSEHELWDVVDSVAVYDAVRTEAAEVAASC